MSKASAKPATEQDAIAAFTAWHAGKLLTFEQQALIREACAEAYLRQLSPYFTAR